MKSTETAFMAAFCCASQAASESTFCVPMGQWMKEEIMDERGLMDKRGAVDKRGGVGCECERNGEHGWRSSEALLNNGQRTHKGPLHAEL